MLQIYNTNIANNALKELVNMWSQMVDVSVNQATISFQMHVFPELRIANWWMLELLDVKYALKDSFCILVSVWVQFLAASLMMIKENV